MQYCKEPNCVGKQQKIFDSILQTIVDQHTELNTMAATGEITPIEAFVCQAALLEAHGQAIASVALHYRYSHSADCPRGDRIRAITLFLVDKAISAATTDSAAASGEPSN